MFCLECCNEISDDAIFCPYCGRRLKEPENINNKKDEIIENFNSLTNKMENENL